MNPHDLRSRAGIRRRLSRAAPLALVALAALGGPQRTAAQAPLGYDDALHVTNRLTFGPRSTEVAATIGSYDANYYAWMKLQLHPTLVAQHPDLAPALAGLQLPATQGAPTSLADIQRAQFVYALLSNRQLQEVMTYFWETHFNTSWYSIRAALINQTIVPAGQEDLVATWLEWDDNQYYRANAIGYFRDLLLRTTKSPGMMIYLNQNVNQGCPNPNENYAREFLELYSMGTISEATGAPNYTQADVVAVARCFTGWGLVNTPPLSPLFTAANHCAGARTIFAGTPHAKLFLATGINQLQDVVDHVAQADVTREFICRKLMRYFLADDAGNPGVHDPLLARMKTAWGTKGDIQSVLLELFTSQEFLGTTYHWCRARTPFEKAVWGQRIWDASLVRLDNLVVDVTKIDAVYFAAANIGELPFTYPSPDGFPLESVAQPGSSVTIETYDYAARLLWDLPAPPTAPFNYYPTHPTILFGPIVGSLTSPSAVATVLLNRIYGSNWTAIDRQAVTDGVARDVLDRLLPLDPNNAFDYQVRVGLGALDANSLIQGSLK